MGKLIIESIKPEELEFISESVGDKKFHYITGPFMKAEVVNGNRRRYPLDVMEAAVDTYRANYIKENRAFGELNHPDSPKINLERASHLIVSLVREGNDFVGKARVMDTPCGLVVQKIMEAGGKIGVSSRGIGSLKEQNGVNVVQSDFQLATAADIVSDPSAPGAFVSGLMEEAAWVWENGIWKEEELVKAKRSISEASKAELEYRMLQNFKNLMSKL